MTPILAGGDAVDGDALVIVLSGALALLGIGAHIAGSAAPARLRQDGDHKFSGPFRTRVREADARMIVLKFSCRSHHIK